MRKNPQNERPEHKIVMDFLVGQTDMINVRRVMILDALLLALGNEECPLDRNKSDHLMVVSFLSMLTKFLDDIQSNINCLEDRADQILKQTFLIDPTEKGSSKAYINECRRALKTLMFSSLGNNNVYDKVNCYENLVELFDALNNLINDVDKNYLLSRVHLQPSSM
jgi:hypothetical protein